MHHKRFAAQLLLAVAFMLVAGSAFAQVSDGSGGLDDVKTWFDTLLPIFAGIVMSVMSLAWGFGWIHGTWVPKAIAGVFGSGVASYVIGLLM